MTVFNQKSVYVLCLLTSLFLIGNLFITDTAGAQSLLPEGLIMEDVFMPGVGKAIGRIQLVQGEVVIMHIDKLKGYRAAPGLPLYKGDTIVTEDRARASLRLNDNSILTIASKTEMVLTQSVYEPERKSRLSFLGLNLGKVRFLVQKFVGFQRSEFKVKTKTAVAGVRGSDFVIEAADTYTRITAGKDTVLDVVSLAFLEKPPVTLKDFQRTSVEMGELPSEIEELSADEVESMLRRDFSVGTEQGAPGEPGVDTDRSMQEGAKETTEQQPGETEPGREEIEVPPMVVDVAPPEEIMETADTSGDGMEFRSAVDDTDPVLTGDDAPDPSQEKLESEIKHTQLPYFPDVPR